MTSHEFVLWFKGFADAASNYTLTPSQWDTVKEQLDKVKILNTKSGGYVISSDIGINGTTTSTNTTAHLTQNNVF
jgi:hypothetical protein